MARYRETVWTTCPACGKKTEWLADEAGTYCGDTVCDTYGDVEKTQRSMRRVAKLEAMGFKAWKGKRVYVNKHNMYFDIKECVWCVARADKPHDFEAIKEMMKDKENA